MLKELKMLLSLRAWWKSTALKAGGIVGILGAVQTYLGTSDGTDLMLMLAGFLHVMPATLGGIFTMGIGLLIWLLRAKTEWSLTELSTGADKAPQPAGPPSTGQKGYADLAVIYVLLVASTLVILKAVFG